METIAIQRLSQTPISLPKVKPAFILPIDRDIEEVAIGFGRAFADRIPTINFATTTHAGVTYRRVDPLRESFEVADRRLQSRLEILCETLRAKY